MADKKDTAQGAAAPGEPKTEENEAALMSLEKHKALFEAIIYKYNLREDKKASDIADFLTGIDGEHDEGRVSAVDFANKFGMTESEARLFLSWISVGIKFKEESDKVRKNL